MVSRAITLFFCFFLGQQVVGAQKYLGLQKSEVLHLMQKEEQRYGLKGHYKEEQNKLSFFVRDSALLPMDFVYQFDSTGICIAEEVSGCCTCADKWVAPENRLKWHPVATDRWLSDYSKKAVLNRKEQNGQVTYTINRVWWTKDEYKNYLKAAGRQ